MARWSPWTLVSIKTLGLRNALHRLRGDLAHLPFSRLALGGFAISAEVEVGVQRFRQNVGLASRLQLPERQKALAARLLGRARWRSLGEADGVWERRDAGSVPQAWWERSLGLCMLCCVNTRALGLS